MANSKGDGLGNRPIVVILGIIASCIAIFTFLTGRQSIIEVISRPSTLPDFTKTPDLSPRTSPTMLQEESLTPTATPTQLVLSPTGTPMVIDSRNPGVSISLIDLPSASSSQQGDVRIQFLAGNEPLRDMEIQLFSISEDITGKWTIAPVGGSGILNTDQNGVIFESLDPGNYAVWNGDYTATWNPLHGSWGEQVLFYASRKDPCQRR